MKVLLSADFGISGGLCSGTAAGYTKTGNGKTWISTHCRSFTGIWIVLKTVSYIMNPAGDARSGAVIAFLPLTGT